MKLEYFQAALYSTKAGINKKVFAWCSHKHESFTLAHNCARKLNKTINDARKIWRVAHIMMRQVRSERQ
jgi:hypothetical protein